MWISSKRLKKIEERLSKLERDVVAHEYADGYSTFHYFGYVTPRYKTLSAGDCFKALMKHLKLELKVEQIEKSTKINFVKPSKKVKDTQ